jgi:hypothetical protein
VQSKRNTLAQLVLPVKRIRKEGSLYRIKTKIVAVADGLVVVRIARTCRTGCALIVDREGKSG